jgi:predicted hotdog family 3-hydroxylacyl-ACP dehydratase
VRTLKRLDEVYAKLPHAGSMRLLERVLDWDEISIRCATDSHRFGSNPLRRQGILASVHAAEYAAQAAALHGVLNARLDHGPVLLLAAIRDLELEVARLDTLSAPLHIDARLEGRAGVNAVYGFALDCDGITCARGRITLMQGASADR